MNRLLISLGVVVGLCLFSGFVGYQLAKGQEAKKDIKIIDTKVNDHNEDLISLQEHTREVEQWKAKAKAANQRIPRVVVSSDCAVNDLERMWHEAKRNADSVLIQN